MRLPWRSTPEEREQRRIDRMLALGYRGVFSLPEVELPEGFVPPSAALFPSRPAEPEDGHEGAP